MVDLGSNRVLGDIVLGSNTNTTQNIVINAATNLAYISASGGSVSVLDTVTGRVTATVPVGGFPESVALNPNGTRLYVSNSAGIVVIDTQTNAIVATIPQTGTHTIVINAAGTLAYTTVGPASEIALINLTTNAVSSYIPLPPGSFPFDAVLLPDGSALYVVDTVGGTVFVVSTATNSIVAAIPAGPGPETLAVSPSGQFVYVGNIAGQMLTIASATNTVVSSLQVGLRPYGFALDSSGRFLYATDGSNPNFYVIDTAQNVVVNTITIGPLDGMVALGQFPSGLVQIPIPTISVGVVWCLFALVALVAGVQLRRGEAARIKTT